MDNLRIMLDTPLFFQLTVFAAFIAFILLSIAQNGLNLNMDFMFSMNCMASQSLLNFVSCFYGGNITVQFYEMGNVVYTTNWYRFPLSDQKSVRRVIERSQIRYCLMGFKIFTCSMETFLAVTKKNIFFHFVGNFHFLIIFHFSHEIGSGVFQKKKSLKFVFSLFLFSVDSNSLLIFLTCSAIIWGINTIYISTST